MWSKIKRLLNKFLLNVWWNIAWLVWCAWFLYDDINDGITWGIWFWPTLGIFHLFSVYSRLRYKIITRAPDIEEESLPILATRYAGLRLRNGRLLFTAILPSNGSFDIDADATCGSGHKAPRWDCSCGFYAVPADKLPRFQYGRAAVVLLVELSGEIIIHDDGYRAEHQRILEVHVANCAECGAPSVCVFFDKRGKPEDAYCDLHAKIRHYTNKPRTVYSLGELSDMSEVRFTKVGN